VLSQSAASLPAWVSTALHNYDHQIDRNIHFSPIVHLYLMIAALISTDSHGWGVDETTAGQTV